MMPKATFFLRFRSFWNEEQFSDKLNNENIKSDLKHVLSKYFLQYINAYITELSNVYVTKFREKLLSVR